MLVGIFWLRIRRSNEWMGWKCNPYFWRQSHAWSEFKQKSILFGLDIYFSGTSKGPKIVLINNSLEYLLPAVAALIAG